ncbi:copper chaperone PCu(A)C [Aureimonas mangrovi]|uniref:copper chaperone PCu(A)C n=1 Tax=Aureimonas mangrovi TaxID=2758041 RepID=UPI00163D8849|nr:copper chaperone PCu(A)C [Aureimonas mangrovi]
MLRASLLSLSLFATAAFAQDQDGHDHHLAEAGGLRAVHAWTNAGDGPDTLVYMEIENRSGREATLTGAHSDVAASATLVGLRNEGGELRMAEIDRMPLPDGSQLQLSPNGLAIRLSAMEGPLARGDSFDLTLTFGDADLDVHVDVEAGNATQHSHAGHAH